MRTRKAKGDESLGDEVSNVERHRWSERTKILDSLVIDRRHAERHSRPQVNARRGQGCMMPSTCILRRTAASAS